MAEKLISVIVPVYNAEQYLKKCLESLVYQSYKNLEIILIDDGSTDSSGEMCDYFEKVYNRVKVVHKDNEGASATRNYGLSIANGDIITYADADDYIHYDMYKLMVPLLDILDVRCVECQFQTVTEDSPVFVPFRFTIGISTIEDVIRSCFIWNPKHSTGLWNKLFYHDDIKDIRMPSVWIHEDEFFLTSYWAKIKKCGSISIPLYYYRKHPASTTARPFADVNPVIIAVYVDRYLMAKKHFPSVSDEILEHLANRYLSGVDRITWSDKYSGYYDPDKSVRLKMTNELFKIYNDLFNCPLIPQDQKDKLIQIKRDFNGYFPR